MSEALKAITDLMERDADFKAKVEALNAGEATTPADFISLAAAHGITVTEADFAAPTTPDSLSDDELAAVSGGGFVPGTSPMCGCMVGGGGEWEGTVCACVLFGVSTVPEGGLVCLGIG